MLPNNPVRHRRLEGLAIFIFCIATYYLSGFGWLFFILLFFLPDLGAIGYLKSHRLGGILYNLTHWYIWPILLVALAYFGSLKAINGPTLPSQHMPIALIWGSHIAFDRMLGWGLKTGDSFYNTDMGEKRNPRKTL